MLLPLMCLVILTGCETNTPTANQNTEQEHSVDQEQVTDEKVSETEETVKQEQAPAEDEKVSGEESIEQKAKEQINCFTSMIGNTPDEVSKVLGEPSSSKNVENSKILAANYYKMPFGEETAKVEVDFDVDTQKVNYISFTIMSANNIEQTKQAFMDVLTSLYGESTIERYMDVKGKQRRDWINEGLNYQLQYYEDNMALDIYPVHE